MKRKLVCSQCGSKCYVNGMTTHLMIMPRKIKACWDCDPKIADKKSVPPEFLELSEIKATIFGN